MDKPIPEAVDVDAILARHLPSKYWDRAKAAFSALAAAQQQGQAVDRERTLTAARFRAACYALKEAVEGPTSEVWRSESGERLKDRPEWVTFYNLVSDMRERGGPDPYAQPMQQGGWEVIQRHVVTKYRDGSVHVADVAAPPSAPVGVEALEARLRARYRDWPTHDSDAEDAVEAVYWAIGEYLNRLRLSLAQQPAPPSAADGEVRGLTRYFPSKPNHPGWEMTPDINGDWVLFEDISHGPATVEKYEPVGLDSGAPIRWIVHCDNHSIVVGDEATAKWLATSLNVSALAQQPAAIPRLANCGRYTATDNTGQHYYLNHANTWQIFQGQHPTAVDGEECPHSEIDGCDICAAQPGGSENG